MNLEKLNQPISSKSVEEHEDLLGEKMIAVKLEYVDRVFSGKVEPLIPIDDKTPEKFLLLLNQYTDVLRKLMEYFKLRAKTQWDPSMYDFVEDDFKRKIFRFYEEDHEHWIEKTLDLVKEEKESSGAVKSELIFPENVDGVRKGTVGIINYDVGSGYDDLLKGSNLDVNGEDVCIGIHIESLFKKTLVDADKNIFSSKTLETLAERIVDLYPEAKAIIADSWIVDTPIAKRMGLNVYNHRESDVGPAFWGQFIDDRGQINKKRVEQFLETGKAPYSVSTGAMPVLDFLKRYLPKERRGKVMLKERNPEITKQWLFEKNAFTSIFDYWNGSDESDLQKVIDLSPIVKKFDTTEEGKGFLSFLLGLKKDNKSVDEVLNDPLLKEYKAKLKIYLDNIEFTNKEVIIE